jgi:hypothetical protein
MLARSSHLCLLAVSDPAHLHNARKRPCAAQAP